MLKKRVLAATCPRPVETREPGAKTAINETTGAPLGRLNAGQGGDP